MSDVAPTFGQSLAGLMEAKGYSQVSFARQVGTSQSVISAVIRGVRCPQLADMHTWADALELVGEARQLFLDLACVAHVPREHEQRLAQIIYDHHRLTHRHQALLDDIAVLQRAAARVADRSDPYRP